MLVREKIKLLRQSRKWSQEYLAEKLGMSANGYGAIERGDSRITVEKLEELSRLFEVSFGELSDDEAANVFNLMGTNLNLGTQNCSVNSTSSEFESLQLKHELEKAQLLNEAQNRELEMYKQKVADLAKVIELLERNQK